MKKHRTYRAYLNHHVVYIEHQPSLRAAKGALIRMLYRVGLQSTWRKWSVECN